MENVWEWTPGLRATDCIYGRNHGRTKPFPAPELYAFEPTIGELMKNIGGINMGSGKFIMPDEIDKVIIRTKDGKEFEGSVTRSEYMPGPQGYSELTVATIKRTSSARQYGIERVVFNNPATVVFWDDGTKTVVYCQDNVKMVKKIVDGKEVEIAKPQKAETYSEETGLAMAILKKHYGNAGGYNNIFRKYIPGMKEREKAEKKARRAAKRRGRRNGKIR